ncbi:hypothetical protein [Chryseobacterium potabilaquae]|nr:hypothetical protein [Chryseobacterium potabilaquae]
MKKILFLMHIMIASHCYHSQISSANVGITSPIPSISALATYTNMPVSIQTGIPNISNDLFSVPTNNKAVTINMSLNYHAGSLMEGGWIGEVGSGWSLLGPSVISREIMNDFDEAFDDASFFNYIKNPFDDIYIFNIPGETGKFRFIRNIGNNTFQLVKVTPSNAKIEYTRTSNSATLIIDSFTITNDKGIKYKFETYSTHTMSVWQSTPGILGPLRTASKKYRSAFYLTSILDENNQELVKCNYIEDITYEIGTPFIDSYTKKLSQIEIKDQGIIQLEYGKDESVVGNLNKKYDKFYVKNLTLKTSDNRFVSKYILNYIDSDARKLQSLSKVDKNEAIVEKTSYEYEQVQMQTSVGFTYKLLPIKKIILPTGGTIQYDFDMVPNYPVFDKGMLHIKRVKYFDNQNITTSPSRVEEYDYRDFNNPNNSSAYFVSDGTFDGTTPANPSIIYKNVKISDGNGYTKYYFIAPDSYPEEPYEVGGTFLFWPNYLMTRGGLIQKKEIYNSNNQKQTEESFEYVFRDTPYPKFFMINSGFANFYVKPMLILNQKISSKTYFNSGYSETKKEITNNDNQLVEKEVETSFDGQIKETSYFYAMEKGNQKLINANILGVPLETVATSKKNSSDPGKILLKKETKYESITHNFPTSMIIYDIPNNITSTEATFNQYDTKGNLEQYTTKEGVPVTLVWGYKKTQPIAKVEGATSAQVAPYIADIVSKSDLDVDAASEKILLSALDTFRNNSNLIGTQITTYTYDPLIGATTITPPSGAREIYQYDLGNRLESVVDERGNILKEYQYNYKH